MKEVQLPLFDLGEVEDKTAIIRQLEKEKLDWIATYNEAERKIHQINEVLDELRATANTVKPTGWEELENFTPRCYEDRVQSSGHRPLLDRCYQDKAPCGLLANDWED